MKKSMKAISHLMISSIVLIFLANPLTITDAANGDLHINNDAITKKVDGGTSGVVTQNTANLFLPATNEHLKQTTQNDQKQIKSAQKAAFQKQSQQTTDADLMKAKEMVFAIKYDNLDVPQTVTESRDDNQLLTILKWPLIAFGALGAIAIGVLLGRRFSSVTKEQSHG
ncbi:hypothetical protein [Lacticaseibacillus paracasei]|uniref:hypothetical protein n=1 Tax=Lacticaseibacillus paracasei TaxID=1597 RepID=UPI002B22DFC0|nr:hypothetical protein [Lacticaseibacillus paracasei]MEB0329678.1 hypothetical protein [Lacticaseibacillus paracasei]